MLVWGSKLYSHTCERIIVFDTTLPGCTRLMEFQVERSSAAGLSAALDQRFEKNAAKQIHSDFSGLDHVPDSEYYGFFHNCNHVTARWLTQLGCHIRGWPVLSHFKVKSVAA